MRLPCVAGLLGAVAGLEMSSVAALLGAVAGVLKAAAAVAVEPDCRVVVRRREPASRDP